MNCCQSFSSVWHFCLFYPGRLCRRLPVQLKHWHCIKQVLRWAMELLESCLVSQQMGRGGSTDAGDAAPCRDSHVLQVTLHQDTEPWEQPYGYGERRRGRSGNRKTIRKLPGNQVFSSSWAKIKEKSKSLPDMEMAGEDEHTPSLSAYNPFQQAS